MWSIEKTSLSYSLVSHPGCWRSWRCTPAVSAPGCSAPAGLPRPSMSPSWPQWRLRHCGEGSGSPLSCSAFHSGMTSHPWWHEETHIKTVSTAFLYGSVFVSVRTWSDASGPVSAPASLLPGCSLRFLWQLWCFSPGCWLILYMAPSLRWSGALSLWPPAAVFDCSARWPQCPRWRSIGGKVRRQGTLHGNPWRTCRSAGRTHPPHRYTVLSHDGTDCWRFPEGRSHKLGIHREGKSGRKIKETK